MLLLPACWVFIRPAVMFLTISEEEDLYKRQDKIIPLKWKKHILLNQFPSKALPFQLFSTDSTMAIESGYIISFPPKFYRFSFSQPVQPWPRPWLPYPHIRLWPHSTCFHLYIWPACYITFQDINTQDIFTNTQLWWYPVFPVWWYHSIPLYTTVYPCVVT